MKALKKLVLSLMPSTAAGCALVIVALVDVTVTSFVVLTGRAIEASATMRTLIEIETYGPLVLLSQKLVACLATIKLFEIFTRIYSKDCSIRFVSTALWVGTGTYFAMIVVIPILQYFFPALTLFLKSITPLP